jgi:hypothetical protein
VSARDRRSHAPDELTPLHAGGRLADPDQSPGRAVDRPPPAAVGRRPLTWKQQVGGEHVRGLPLHRRAGRPDLRRCRPSRRRRCRRHSLRWCCPGRIRRHRRRRHWRIRPRRHRQQRRRRDVAADAYLRPRNRRAAQRRRRLRRPRRRVRERVPRRLHVKRPLRRMTRPGVSLRERRRPLLAARRCRRSRASGRSRRPRRLGHWHWHWHWHWHRRRPWRTRGRRLRGRRRRRRHGWVAGVGERFRIGQLLHHRQVGQRLIRRLPVGKRAAGGTRLLRVTGSERVDLRGLARVGGRLVVVFFCHHGRPQ